MRRQTPSEVIASFADVHGDRYDYSKSIYRYALEKIDIICRLHGPFQQTPSKHKNGSGCPKCAFARSQDYKRITWGRFMAKTMGLYGQRYVYEHKNLRSSEEKIRFRCSIHGVIEQRIDTHLKGGGCPRCGIEKRGMSTRKSTEAFIEEATLKHLGLYEYGKVKYVKAHNKVEIVCTRHGEFWQTPRNHLSGTGCPECTVATRVSLRGKAWLSSIGKPLALEYRLPENRRLTVDGYDYSTNTAYMFHGDYWHGNPLVYHGDAINQHNKKSFGELYRRTLEIEAEIISYGYNLIRCWESEWVEKVGRKQASHIQLIGVPVGHDLINDSEVECGLR